MFATFGNLKIMIKSELRVRRKGEGEVTCFLPQVFIADVSLPEVSKLETLVKIHLETFHNHLFDLRVTF